MLGGLIASGVANASSFDPRVVGKGFTGVADEDFTAAAVNPALLNEYDGDDDFYTHLGLGVGVSDQYKVVDTANDLVDMLDVYQSDDDPTEILNKLDEAHGKQMQAKAGLNLWTALPNQYVSTALFIKNDTSINAAIYNWDDENTIDDPKSKAIGNAIAVSDVGFAFAKSFDELGGLGIGLNLKYQDIRVMTYDPVVDDFDDEKLSDSVSSTGAFNMDLGFHKVFDTSYGDLAVGLVANNLISQTVDVTSYTGDYSYDYTLEPKVTLGTSYKLGMVSLSADVDLTEQEVFGVTMTDENTYQKLNDTTQSVGLGMEFDLWEWAQMQVGYRKDLQGYYDDIYTVGLGLSPFDVVSISLAGFYGKNDTYGASLQFGMKL